MRAGICTIQQALTAEAESIVKQAVSLARRRGHAQVTPLHVASAMLVSSTGLLRRACLYCHSHPLQCKALELCFNVALNRLPASSPSPLLGPHYVKPSLSNALVAAFKRAQAHQRRGSVENQQQPILALKIELDQLIISILDDPSVSRVMREAGFSSTQVKNRVEQTVSLEICSPLSSHSKESTKPTLVLAPNLHQSSPFNQFGVSLSKPFDKIRNDDVMSVLDELSNRRRRNTVIVGECLSTVEGVIRGVIEEFEKGNVPKDMKYVQFISVPLLSLRNLSKEEIEKKLLELRCIVKSSMGRGVILYLGDLKWVSEFWSNYAEQRSYYSPVEQIVMEIKRLVCGNGEAGRFWLMGIATFHTYMRCKTGQPSLETIWELHPLTVPVGSLSLSLNLDRDCAETVEKDKRSTPIASPAASIVSGLPLWFQKYREETRRNQTDNEECTNVKSSSLSPSSSNSISSLECNLNLHLWAATLGPKRSPKEYQFWGVTTDNHEGNAETSSSLPDRPEAKPELFSNPNSSPNSASSSEIIVEDTDSLQEFKEFTPENLTILCDALGKTVPWQKEIVPEVANTVLECRSRESKEECWLFFLGADSKAKEKIARELSKLVFGSQTNFVTIGLSSFSSTKVEDLAGELKNKRTRDEFGCTYLQRFAEAVNENPHRVFFMEDVDQIDYFSQKGIKKAIENGSITLADHGEPFPLKDAIIILSCDCESFTSAPRRQKSSHIESVVESKDGDQVEDQKSSSSVSLDLNISIEGDNGDEHVDYDNGILEAVDRKIIFRIIN